MGIARRDWDKVKPWIALMTGINEDGFITA
jgi:hypothetical protein